MLRVLGHPSVWDSARFALDLTFGMYRKRAACLHEWGLVGSSVSVLDVGCGTGQYAKLGFGSYIGIDHSTRYIDHALKRRGGPGRTFWRMDVTELTLPDCGFD